MPWGQLQDEKLVELLGQELDGSIISSEPSLVVDKIHTDGVGGFALTFSSNHVLNVFPASSSEMEWLLKRKSGEFLILQNGILNGSLGRFIEA